MQELHHQHIPSPPLPCRVWPPDVLPSGPFQQTARLKRHKFHFLKTRKLDCNSLSFRRMENRGVVGTVVSP